VVLTTFSEDDMLSFLPRSLKILSHLQQEPKESEMGKVGTGTSTDVSHKIFNNFLLFFLSTAFAVA
jgi:hypothetical protein